MRYFLGQVRGQAWNVMGIGDTGPGRAATTPWGASLSEGGPLKVGLLQKCYAVTDRTATGIQGVNSTEIRALLPSF